MTRAEYYRFAEFYAGIMPPLPFAEFNAGLTDSSRPHLPEAKALLRGGFIGIVDLVDCTYRAVNPWFFGPVGLVLANPRQVPFTRHKGAA